MRLFCALLALTCLPACAPILAMVGYSNSVVQVAVQLDRIKLASDGVSFLKSGKTVTDHAVSKLVGADCNLMHVVTTEPVCKSKTEAVALDTTAAVRVNLAAVSDEWNGRDAFRALSAEGYGDDVATVVPVAAVLPNAGEAAPTE